MNSERIGREYDAEVITFSHFVPRIQLMRAAERDEREIINERSLLVSKIRLECMTFCQKSRFSNNQKVIQLFLKVILQGLPSPEWKEKEFGARFNFSRVAGSNILDIQLRKIGSKVRKPELSSL